MNKKLWILYIVFIDFVIFSAYVVWQEGYLSFITAGTSSLWSMQILIDLVIACLLICSWMLWDAKQRGANAWPYVVATFFTGSIAPLWYLIRREHAKA